MDWTSALLLGAVSLIFSTMFGLLMRATITKMATLELEVRAMSETGRKEIGKVADCLKGEIRSLSEMSKRELEKISDSVFGEIEGVSNTVEEKYMPRNECGLVHKMLGMQIDSLTNILIRLSATNSTIGDTLTETNKRLDRLTYELETLSRTVASAGKTSSM